MIRQISNQQNLNKGGKKISEKVLGSTISLSWQELQQLSWDHEGTMHEDKSRYDETLGWEEGVTAQPCQHLLLPSGGRNARLHHAELTGFFCHVWYCQLIALITHKNFCDTGKPCSRSFISWTKTNTPPCLTQRLLNLNNGSALVIITTDIPVVVRFSLSH